MLSISSPFSLRNLAVRSAVQTCGVCPPGNPSAWRSFRTSRTLIENERTPAETAGEMYFACANLLILSLSPTLIFMGSAPSRDRIDRNIVKVNSTRYSICFS